MDKEMYEKGTGKEIVRYETCEKRIDKKRDKEMYEKRIG
jgi:hypothetical protein